MKRSLKNALGGVSLYPADVKELEAKLARRPTNHSARCQLLGYYWCKQNLGLMYRRKLEEHALWVIANLPEHELAGSNLVFLSVSRNGSYVYENARDLWIGHLETNQDNLAIIDNASKFFAGPEPEVASALCLKGKSLDPKNPRWSKKLASLYECTFVPADHKESVKAELENALALSPAGDKPRLLAELARFAYASDGDSQKAVKYCETIIDTSKGKGQRQKNWLSIQSAYAILGRICLANLDLAGTRKYLLLAFSSPETMPIMIIGTELRSFLCELAVSGETRYVDEVLLSSREKPDNMWLSLLEFGSNPIIFYRYSDYSFIFESMDLSWSGLPCYETSAELGRGLIGSEPRSASDFSQIPQTEDSMRGKSPQQVWDAIREGMQPDQFDQAAEGLDASIVLDRVPEETRERFIDWSRRSAVMLQQNWWSAVHSSIEYQDERGLHLIVSFLYKDLPFETARNTCWWSVWIWQQRMHASIAVIGIDLYGRRNFCAYALRA